MPALTGLRGLCALWVLLYHAWSYAGPQAITYDIFGEPIRFHVFFSIGWAGVQVLFVLSAFLLTLPYASASAGLRAHPGAGGYLVRRIARVFPAYHVQLFILLLVGVLFGSGLAIEWGQLPQYLLMMFMPPPMGVGSPYMLNGVWWTLPIELSFYLLLPLIAWLASWRRRWLLLFFSLGVMAAWRYYVLAVIQPDERPLWVTQLPGSMDSFGLGMLGAVIHVHFTRVSENFERYQRVLYGLLLLTPLVFFGLGHWMAEAYTSYWKVTTIMFTWTPVFNFAVIILILCCALNHGLLMRLLANRVVFFSGTISYGVYLWHLPAEHWLKTTSFIADYDGYQFPRLLLGMFVMAVIGATLSWFLVEKRAIGYARRFK